MLNYFLKEQYKLFVYTKSTFSRYRLKCYYIKDSSSRSTNIFSAFFSIVNEIIINLIHGWKKYIFVLVLLKKIPKKTPFKRSKASSLLTAR